MNFETKTIYSSGIKATLYLRQPSIFVRKIVVFDMAARDGGFHSNSIKSTNIHFSYYHRQKHRHILRSFRIYASNI